jgi:hypothetical protein
MEKGELHMPNGINLQVINRSNDANNSEILIFQKNVAPGYSEIAVAWKVIQNLGNGDRHPFAYTYDLAVDANDSYGNYTPQLSPATPGSAYQMVLNTSGDVLQPYSPGSASPTDIDVRNDLTTGSIDANIYRSGLLLATKTNVVPGQKATFVFKPTIFIGVASQIQQGEVIDSAVLTSVNMEISLLGISSADIIMSGGGSGTSSVPYTFALQNVVFS